jgi:glycosyltransferase involved in cell wall biosynthesis
MKIAVYAIAKNEEQFVKRWYESAKQADGLFILDTGSTDNTAAVAESLGVTVETLVVDPWRFDVARNASLAMIPDDYDMCIALDMDEVLVEGWREHLELVGNVNRPRYEYTWSWNGDEPDLVYGGDKIHSRYGFVWKHPVHEVLACEGEEVQAWCELKIHHHPDSTKSRGHYFPLLKLAVSEDPEDDRNAHYLAREYFFHNQYDDAAQEFKRHLALPRSKWLPERAASMRYLSKCEPDNREVWLLRAAAECIGRREAWVDLAFLYYEQKSWAACLASCRRALSITEKPLEYLCDAIAWGSAPFDLAALAAFNLGMFEDARRYGKEALMLCPDDERLKLNMTFYRAV